MNRKWQKRDEFILPIAFPVATNPFLNSNFTSRLPAENWTFRICGLIFHPIAVFQGSIRLLSCISFAPAFATAIAIITALPFSSRTTSIHSSVIHLHRDVAQTGCFCRYYYFLLDQEVVEGIRRKVFRLHYAHPPRNGATQQIHLHTPQMTSMMGVNSTII